MYGLTVSNKSLFLAASAAGAIACISVCFRRYGQSGPYSSSGVSFLQKIQRCLVDKTKESISIEWYPLDSFPKNAQTRPQDNGHAVSGSVRDTARTAINLSIFAAGYVPYEISPSTHSNVGPRSHPHYAPADLNQDFREDTPNDGNIIVGIDVDYYVVDWSKYLVGCPAIFHTFAPTTVAGNDGECRFRVSNDEVLYEVSGGGSWRHKIWNWTAFGEFIRVDTHRRSWNWQQYLLALLGVRRTVLYKVAFARPWQDCPHRAIVWLIPQYSYYHCALLPSEMHVRELRHVKFSDDDRPGWNTIVSLDGNKPVISLGREGEDLAVSIDKVHYDVLMGLKTTQSVTTRCLGIGITDRVSMALIAQYFENKFGSCSDPDRLANPYKPKVHWPLNSFADVEDVSARTYSPPLVSDENMMPMIKRWESLSTSLNTRVFSVRNDKIPNASHYTYIREFLELLVPEAGVGTPYSLEDAAEMLDKPSQVLMISNIWDTADMPPRNLIECFLKNEPCKKDARIISSFPDMRYLLHFSKFTLCFRDQMLHAEHNEHWFMPGKTPIIIADEVCNYVSNVEEPMEIDYANLDGTVSAWCQKNIMNAAYKRYFAKEYHKELDGYLNSLISCPARSKRFGFRYDAGPGVKSGSPTTCDANTILNGYVQYYSIRKYYGASLPKEEAFRLIGLAFGDDCLFSAKYKKSINAAAGSLGLTVKCENYKPDEGITFLSRVFPDPTNTSTSFQDPLRTLRKLHITTRNPNIPLADAAYDRCSGYLVIDPYTPVVSNYCRSMIRLYDKEIDHTKRKARKSRDLEKPYWYSAECNSWPQVEADYDLMLNCFSARTGIPVSELTSLSALLDTIQDPWEVPTINRDEEPFPWKGTVYPDGDVEASVDLRSVMDDTLVVQHGTDTNGEGNQPQSKSNSTSQRVDHSRDPTTERTQTTSRDRSRDGCQGSSGSKRVYHKEHSDDTTRSEHVPGEAIRGKMDRRRGGHHAKPFVPTLGGTDGRRPNKGASQTKGRGGGRSQRGKGSAH